MQTIGRDETRTLLQNRSDVTVIEALSRENFAEFHLPGAKNVPLDDDFEKNIRRITAALCKRASSDRKIGDRKIRQNRER